MPTVELSFTPLPAHVRTARLIASTVGRRVGLDESLVDEVRLAVGEACARAVGVQRSGGQADDVVVAFSDDDGMFTVTVHDWAGAGSEVEMPDLVEATEDLDEAFHPGFGLAVVSGLVDDVEVTSGEPGTVVRMRWPLSSSVSS
ncbi:MAG TPA: ATP-binding protein [Mycobacteriales bacterium]|nr:ATP-binding protein [Mycobacteriales bacterium]